MKNVFFPIVFLLLATSMSGQYNSYPVSGGLLGAANFSKFNLTGDNPLDIEYDFETGWAAGIWANFPLSERLSIEPQLMYSKYNFSSDSLTSLLADGSLSYISLPVLFKIHLGKLFAITLGPEIEFLTDVDDGFDGTFNNREKDDFAPINFSGTAGLEIWPRGVVTVFGRYQYGFTNVDERRFAPNPAENADYHISNIQAGIKVRLFGGKPKDSDGDGVADKNDKCPNALGFERYAGCPIPDTDKDGINDEIDKCVKQAGTHKYSGCPVPDTDADGINDENDKCPKEAGTAKYNGCPVPDTDGDGINDENDKCPNQAGTAKYNGCPNPDTDGDGVNDDTDKCPNQAGVAKLMGCPDRDNDGISDAEDRCPDLPGKVDNSGCPVIENAKFNTQRIQFVTGSSTLTADSKLNIKEGAKLLNSAEYNKLKVEVRGHTDNTGDAASNLKLSQKRADAVKAELIKNGVSADRITAVGFGETTPIADNATAEGRAKNRRVAFDVSQ